MSLLGAVIREGKREVAWVHMGFEYLVFTNLTGFDDPSWKLTFCWLCIAMGGRWRWRILGCGLEDSFGLGEGLVRKNIPLIQTIYILLLARHGQEFAQG